MAVHTVWGHFKMSFFHFNNHIQDSKKYIDQYRTTALIMF
jgi:hypothetical protein